MVDVVVNHVGPVEQDYSQISPFDHKRHYHKYCKIENWDDQWQLEVKTQIKLT
jgi:hypothetical protein